MFKPNVLVVRRGPQVELLSSTFDHEEGVDDKGRDPESGTGFDCRFRKKNLAKGCWCNWLVVSGLLWPWSYRLIIRALNLQSHTVLPLPGTYSKGPLLAYCVSVLGLTVSSSSSLAAAAVAAVARAQLRRVRPRWRQRQNL
jgi:hypothetical protein